MKPERAGDRPGALRATYRDVATGTSQTLRPMGLAYQPTFTPGQVAPISR